ncbi:MULTISPECIES: hypothetical protein [unclassified Psychrobacter]|jgi:hypothetical protein|uniref:hypothetical protein n=1 Tax=unclassified Psychrobacter TaxID=196806 RepID=UPI003FD9D812
MKTKTPSAQAYRKQYETAKSLGAAMLACNAVLVPEGYNNLYLLIQNFQRPIVSHNDSADVDYARGLQAHVAGTVKTNFEGQWTLIETESGAISKFAEDIAVKHGGILPLVRIYDGFVGDGDNIKGSREYELIDCAITFTDGGGEIDAASRSQILQVQASCRYNYFGQSGKIGATGSGADVFADTLTNALGSLSSLVPQGGLDGVTIFG